MMRASNLIGKQIQIIRPTSSYLVDMLIYIDRIHRGLPEHSGALWKGKIVEEVHTKRNGVSI